jgi:hypothetical protein
VALAFWAYYMLMYSWLRNMEVESLSFEWLGNHFDDCDRDVLIPPSSLPVPRTEVYPLFSGKSLMLIFSI